jgi:hypothetical protein
MINRALDLPFPEPEETYSTSDYLYDELEIPKTATGRLPSAQRTRAGLAAEQIEDLGETGRRRPPAGRPGDGDGRSRGRGRGERGGQSGGRRTGQGDGQGKPAAKAADGADASAPRKPRQRRRRRLSGGDGGATNGQSTES